MPRAKWLWDYGADAAENLYTKLMRERDPRFDPRVKEAQRLANLRVEADYSMPDVPTVKLSQFEGYPFVTSMSDRLAAGERILRINDVELNDPVNLYGGQGYTVNPTLPGSVWASAKGPSNQIIGLAGEMERMTGQKPLFMPWRMAPSGGDFASMTGETMLAYASSAMNKTNKRKLDRLIKKQIPDWPGVDAGPEAIAAYRAAPDAVRKTLKNNMDVNFRDRGGLSLGEARLAVADPEQLGAPDAGTMYVGRVDPSRGLLEDTGHPSYPYGVPGEGIGRLDPKGAPIITDLLDEDVTRYVGDEGGFVTSNWGQQRGIAPGAPQQTDIRALQMKPYGGILTEDKLRKLSDRGYDVGASYPEYLAALAGGTAAGIGAYSAMEDPEVDDILYRLGDYTDMADEAEGFDFRRDMPLTAGIIDTVGENLELLDMPLQGLLGLATLASGQGLDAAVRNTQRPPDETMFDFGAWVQDIAQQNPVTKPYSAGIGTAAYTLPQVFSPW